MVVHCALIIALSQYQCKQGRAPHRATFEKKEEKEIIYIYILSFA